MDERKRKISYFYDSECADRGERARGGKEDEEEPAPSLFRHANLPPL